MTEAIIIEKDAGGERRTRRVVVRPPFPGDVEVAPDVAPGDAATADKPLSRLHLRDRRLFF
jgi:hypothetical protein